VPALDRRRAGPPYLSSSKAVPGQDFVYCNVLPGLNRGRESVHYTPWGVPRLDAAAERAFRSAGVRPVRVTRSGYLATAMMDQSAGLRCFCGTFPVGHLA